MRNQWRNAGKNHWRKCWKYSGGIPKWISGVMPERMPERVLWWINEATLEAILGEISNGIPERIIETIPKRTSGGYRYSSVKLNVDISEGINELILAGIPKRSLPKGSYPGRKFGQNRGGIPDELLTITSGRNRKEFRKKCLTEFLNESRKKPLRQTLKKTIMKS